MKSEFCEQNCGNKSNKSQNIPWGKMAVVTLKLVNFNTIMRGKNMTKLDYEEVRMYEMS